MGIILLNPSERTRHKLSLQTTQKNDIDNEQFFTIEGMDLKQCLDWQSEERKKYPNCVFKGTSTPLYNCHGMTFASRRTGVFEDEVINKIIKEDNYIPVKNEQEVMVGDIVIYYQYGGISHSGIVVQTENVGGVPNIKIWSKWKFFKEVIHPVGESPYSLGARSFFRLTHEFEIKHK
jgi:hypothetical protein